MTDPKPAELTEAEIRSLEEPLANWAVSQVWLDDTDPLCIEVARIVAAREAAARREYQAKVARVESLAEDWERMAAEDAPEDPEAARWFRYAARNVRGRLQGPTAALAEPERDEEGGR